MGIQTHINSLSKQAMATSWLAAPRRLLLLANRGIAMLSSRLPKGLYPRSILIVVTPIVLLQSVVAYVFMERHWETVTQRLSSAVTGQIAAIIDVLETYPQDTGYENISRIAADHLGLRVTVMPHGPLPPAAPKPFFSLLDRELSWQITKRIEKPFWIDTVGNSNIIEIRIKLKDKILRIFARRNQAYASNSHIFLMWMIGTSLVLIGIALLFLRNQIRPILRLADAAEEFGKGRKVEDYTPRGAREVRRASEAFLAMRDRIERQIDQRTTMLSGVSHDLRTILTRFGLELALLEESTDIAALQADIEEMGQMLEEYLAFAKGDTGEDSRPENVRTLLNDTVERVNRNGSDVALTSFTGDPIVACRPTAIRRAIMNLIDNAAKYSTSVKVKAEHENGHLTVMVDDDGPGVPEEEREAIFRPFYRLDGARNVDGGGTGLGLAIARDIARSHGGEITLDESPSGGLRAIMTIPA